MTNEEREQQEAIHQALAGTLSLPEGHMLTGWIVVYESLGPALLSC